MRQTGRNCKRALPQDVNVTQEKLFRKNLIELATIEMPGTGTFSATCCFDFVDYPLP
jgi:hypothetical protein